MAQSFFDAGNTCEIGGLLIGYKALSICTITNITVSSSQGKNANVEFELNGAFHSCQAEQMIRQSHGFPRILGIWHSHILDVDRFSDQDRISNQVMAMCLNGTVSMLVTGDIANEKINISSYYVSKGKPEKLCATFHGKMKP